MSKAYDQTLLSLFKSLSNELIITIHTASLEATQVNIRMYADVGKVSIELGETEDGNPFCLDLFEFKLTNYLELKYFFAMDRRDIQDIMQKIGRYVEPIILSGVVEELY